MQRNNKITKNSSKARPGQSKRVTTTVVVQNNKKKKNNQGGQRPTNNTPGLSMCATKYAMAISDPWSPAAAGACVPTFPSRASQKVAIYSRTTAFVGTNGVGWVVMSPCLANNMGGLWTTTATWAGSQTTNIDVSTTSTGAGTVAANNFVNGPFSAAQLTPGATNSSVVSGRIVSVGLSIQYTGTTLNQGGLLYGLVEPNHGNLNGRNISNISSYREAYVVTSGSKKHWFTMAGQSDTEVQYPDATGVTADDILKNIFPYSEGFQIDSTMTTTGACPLAVIFTGVAGNSFEIEIVMHCEYVGTAAGPAATPTHSDAIGFQTVNTAAQRLQQSAMAHPNMSRPALMWQTIKEVAHELAPVANFAYKAAQTPMGRAAIGQLPNLGRLMLM